MKFAMRYFKTNTDMEAVEIGDRILFNRDGNTDGLELWTVTDGGMSYPAVKKIGIDLLNTVQYKDGAPTNKTLLQHGLEKGYIRLTQNAANKNSQKQLSEYLFEMQNQLTIDCVKYWRRLLDGELEPDEAGKILEALEIVERKIKYAKNCCHWIKNEWDKTKE